MIEASLEPVNEKWIAALDGQQLFTLLPEGSDFSGRGDGCEVRVVMQGGQAAVRPNTAGRDNAPGSPCPPSSPLAPGSPVAPAAHHWPGLSLAQPNRFWLVCLGLGALAAVANINRYRRRSRMRSGLSAMGPGPDGGSALSGEAEKG